MGVASYALYRGWLGGLQRWFGGGRGGSMLVVSTRVSIMVGDESGWRMSLRDNQKHTYRLSNKMSLAYP